MFLVGLSVKKAEFITPEIIGLIFKHYGGGKNLLDIKFVCMCVLLSFYVLGGLTLSLKTFIIRFL